METETLLRFLAVIMAGGLLLSSIDYSPVLTYIKGLFKRTPVDNNKEEEVDFLEIVGLWHKLKDKCEVYGLDQAVEKLDEVFPLLNVEE